MLKLPDTISEEELAQVLAKTKTPHHRAAFAVAFYECMRVSEVIKLQKEDIRRDTKLLHIREAKGHKDRRIPIAPEIQKYLKYFPMRCRTTRALQIAWNRATKRALGRSLNFHILRHSGITFYIVKKKWGTLEVQRLAGHSKIATTQIYTHINPTDLVERMWENR